MPNFDIQKVCPPLFKLSVIRIDSPNSNRGEAYGQDAAFFKANPKRRLYLRDAQYGEFDLELELGDWLSLPKLHVLVAQVSSGVHMITPVYRGKAFFKQDVETDAEVGLILDAMARREGFDIADWLKCENVYGRTASDRLQC